MKYINASHQNINRRSVARRLPRITAHTAPGILQRKANCSCGGGCPACQTEQVIQSNLNISPSNDSYEQEADRVATRVTQMSEPTIQRKNSYDEAHTRNTPEMDRRIQTKQTPAQQKSMPSIVDNVLQQPGKALNNDGRQFMESRFGHDFSKIRIHTGSMAAQSADAVGARAYTVGHNIVFSDNEYQPQTTSGKQLLAHELTHTLQQSTTGGPTLMRATAEDCTEKGKTNTDLLAIHKRARGLLKTAIDKTAKRDSRGARTPEVKAALLQWFKIDLNSSGPQVFGNAKALGHIIDAMQSIFDGSDSVAYECDENGFFEICKENRNAVTLLNIHICPNWWQLSEDRQPIVLIHEWGHKFGRGINRAIETYCWEKAFPELPRDNRITLPDAYEGYISLLSQGKGTC